MSLFRKREGIFETGKVIYLPVDTLRPNPNQPRTQFDPGGLEELAQSIRENGLIQPILVRQLLDGDYELIAGHRRWMAVR